MEEHKAASSTNGSPFKVVSTPNGPESSSSTSKNPMWSANNIRDLEDDSSLDNLLNGPDESNERSRERDDSSPFSELFPHKFLTDNGVLIPATPSTNQVRNSSLFVSQSPLLKQRRTNGQKSHFCTHCDAGFTRRTTLNKHVRDKHTPNLAPIKYCPLTGCTFSTRNPNLLLTHKRIHRFTGKPQYYCRSCKLRYSHRRSLLQHLTRHHSSDASLIGMGGETAAESPSTSAPVAQRPSTRSSCEPTVPPVKKPSPNGSVCSTKAKKTYDCDRCSFSGKSFRSLFTHRTRSHVQKESASVTCVYCRKQFPSDRLANHIKSQHKPRSSKQFACESCEFVTTTKRVFTAHKKMHQYEEDRIKVAAAVALPPVPEPQNFVLTPPPPRLNGISSSSPNAVVVPEYETCIHHLHQANANLLQLNRRREGELTSLRQSVMQLIKLFLPNTHPSVQPQTWHLITGQNVDRLVGELLLNQYNK